MPHILNALLSDKLFTLVFAPQRKQKLHVTHLCLSRTKKHMPGPEWSYLWQMLFLSIAAGEAERLQGTGSHWGSFVRSHTPWALPGTALYVIYTPPVLAFTFPKQHHRSCDPVLKPGFTPAIFYHFPIVKRPDIEVSTWSWTASCLLLPQEVLALVADSGTLFCPLSDKMRNSEFHWIAHCTGFTTWDQLRRIPSPSQPASKAGAN